MQTDSVENIFSRAWSLLSKNWVIIVPGLIVGIIAGIIDAFVSPQPQVLYSATGGDVITSTTGTEHHFIRGAIAGAVGVLSFLVTQTYTTGMAGAAWERGVATLADGSASFREDAGRLFAALLLLAVILVVAGIVTLGLGWFVVLFFAIYMVPAVVLDNHGAIDALKISAKIALKRAGATIIIILLLFVISLGVTLLTAPLAFIPFLGPIVLMVVSQAVAAYATLVIVGEYLNVRRSPDIIVSGPSV